MRWLALLVLALALVAAGCGGSDDESSAVDETTTVEETTTAGEKTTDETSTTDGDLSDVLGDEDCVKLASIGATFAQAISGATDEEAVEAFRQLADDVPDEIRADVQVLADWFAEYTAKLDDIGLEPGSTPTAEQIQQLQAALAASNQDEVSAASERIGVWANENCSAAGG